MVISATSGRSDRGGAAAEFEPTARKLRVEHFAFMRAYVQGLDLRDIWERYLGVEGNHADLRVVHRTVAWLRDAFAAAAHRHSRHGLARLVRIDIAKPTSQDNPSLEGFAAERGLEDFSYQEQLASYQETYGKATSREKRNAALVRRQLDAISWLERIAVDSPHADDGVRAWMPLELAKQLEAAGMITLRQLAERINGVGRNWHTPVQAIGTGKAERIVSLLRSFQVSTGLYIGTHALQTFPISEASTLRSVVAAATDIVPLEKFIVPARLDGSQGRFRVPQDGCRLGAKTDYDALIEFLREKQEAASGRPVLTVSSDQLAWLSNLEPTPYAYRSECERFMLWTILERDKPLSSIDSDDVNAYASFLKDPQPAARWCGPRSRKRWGPSWRPFEGPLSAAAQRRALTMLGTFYRYLVERHYISCNPWASLKKPRVPSRDTGSRRSFTEFEWDLICKRLTMLPPTSANLRLRFALPLLYAGRLRRSEVLRARVGHILRTEVPATLTKPALVGWELRVMAKNGSQRLVPLSQVHVNALSVYLEARGLPADISDLRNADVYLLGQATDLQEQAPWAASRPTDPRLGIGAQTFYDQLKGFFGDCAVSFAKAEPELAAQLARASTFWLRHTGIAHSLAAGTPLEVEMKVAGHASISTTSQYVDVEARRRLEGSVSFLKKQRSVI